MIDLFLDLVESLFRRQRGVPEAELLSEQVGVVSLGYDDRLIRAPVEEERIELEVLPSGTAVEDLRHILIANSLASRHKRLEGARQAEAVVKSCVRIRAEEGLDVLAALQIARASQLRA